MSLNRRKAIRGTLIIKVNGYYLDCIAILFLAGSLSKSWFQLIFKIFIGILRDLKTILARLVKIKDKLRKGMKRSYLKYINFTKMTLFLIATSSDIYRNVDEPQ